jgi:hypothetical protein
VATQIAGPEEVIEALADVLDAEQVCDPSVTCRHIEGKPMSAFLIGSVMLTTRGCSSCNRAKHWCLDTWPPFFQTLPET